MKHQFLCQALLAAILCAGSMPSIDAAKDSPARLSDQEFWRLVSEFSEPDGTFHSENLVSNEALFQTIIPALTQTAVPGRAYMGVGSEQNFSYIVALRPSIAFIVDIRRGNLDLHMIYKALFEKSTGRSDFVSRLFSRKMPPDMSASLTVAEIFTACRNAAPDQALYEQNLKDIKSHLVTTHGFKLSKGDLDGIDFVYGAWFRSGPDIRYELTNAGRGFRGGRGPGDGFPTYADLMTASDGTGRKLSYLATESAFKLMKDLESRNLIIPVVGNFGGPKALRAVGSYLKQNQTVVSAFYVSNVEQYLREGGLWEKFCSNAAALPIDGSSTFIRSARGGFRGQWNAAGPGFGLELVLIKAVVTSCADPIR